MVSHSDRPEPRPDDRLDARADDRPGEARDVAVFDFDKTLSTRDNVLPFLVACVGRSAVVRCLFATAPAVLRGQRDEIKGRLVGLLAGRDEDEIRLVASAFADDVVAHHLRPDVVARAGWHVAQGHRVVVVSASFSWYLEPIARHLVLDAVLATDLAVADGRLTGALDGPNVRRSEKVRRLDQWLDRRPATIWAYGDSAGDRELLARADIAVRVGRRPLSEAPDEQQVAFAGRGPAGPDSASGTERVAP